MLRSPGFQRQALPIYVASARTCGPTPPGRGWLSKQLHLHGTSLEPLDDLCSVGMSVTSAMAFTATTGRAFWTGPARTWAGPDETASALNRPFADSAVRHVDDAEQVVASMGQWELDAASSSVISTAARSPDSNAPSTEERYVPSTQESPAKSTRPPWIDWPSFV